MTESKGRLHVTVLDRETGETISDAAVLLQCAGRDTRTGRSDADGAVLFSVPTPPVAYSQAPRVREKPYAAVDLRIVAKGYVTVSIIGEQVFPEQRTKCTVRMERVQAEHPESERVTVVPDHGLYRAGTEGTDAKQARSTVSVTDSFRRAFVPETIRVHLGAPGSPARNVTVPFLDYIKSVACSEVYPTWPDNALIANIIAQVSLALNRIYTEWYPSQGYDFDITNSTAYDQYYVHERGIFEKIDTLADGYFTNYIARGNQLEPLFAQYCDGANTTCEGMSQWGSVSLARKDYTPIRILQYYYGSNVSIRQAPVETDVKESFPGEFGEGSVSPEVLQLQNRLNRIAISFPALPFILPVSGTYGTSTTLAVRAFQRLFRIRETGRVDRETWYRIQYIYTAVKKLAELGSEGELPQSDTFNGKVLQTGSRGTEVLRIQSYLSTLSGKLGSDVVPYPDVNGVYDSATREAVRTFQGYYGLAQTGTVNEATWNAIVTTYHALGGGEEPTEAPPYPGFVLRRGSRGDSVFLLQTMLNAVLTTGTPLAVDGVFGPQTEKSVRAYQSARGLAVDGLVGPKTWDALSREYARIRSDEDVG